jgi:TetR/AcrR family transcriptional regulator
VRESSRADRQIPTGRKKISSRERILEAALAQFADRGFEGTTTRSVARASGVTQPLVHYHFPTKEALWSAAVERALAREGILFAGLSSELGDLDPTGRLRVILRRFVRHAAEQAELYKLVAREGARPGPRLDWLVDCYVRRIYQELWEAFRVGSQQGWARSVPPQHLIFIVLAAATQVFQMPALAREVFDMDVRTPETIEAHADTLIELLFHGLLVEETPSPPSPP